MTVTPSSIKNRFPEFDSTEDARIQLFIDDAEIILNESYWGTKYDLGVSYYVAHKLTLAIRSENGNEDGAGVISGKAVEGVSISYATPTINSATDSDFMSTSYGIQYLSLMKTLGIAGCVV